MVENTTTARTYDCCVLGAGSAGLGAALAASRHGLSVLLIERSEQIGGTVTRGGVHVWEMGAGGTGLPFEIYRRLRAIPNAIGIYSIGRHICHPEHNDPPFPGGESIIDPTRRYIDTLQRSGGRGLGADAAFCRATWHGVPFEPDAYIQVIQDMLRESGHCDVLLKTTVEDVARCGSRIVSATLSNGMGISADIWIDATDGTFCTAAGADTLQGIDPRDRFQEPSAPEEPSRVLNAATLIFRVAPTPTPAIEPLPDNVPASLWWTECVPAMSCTHLPNGDRHCNMLPTMQGREYMEMGEVAAYVECYRRTRCYWHHVQTHFPEFRGFRISWTAPAIGVRETRRVMTEFMLTEEDLRAGLSGQDHDDIIAISDHALDRHGAGSKGCGELVEPYGIPFRCLIPRGLTNLMITGRAAGFSSIAASSCRLSRTMMQLGQAAGTAAALAQASRCPLTMVDPAKLRDMLRAQHVQLDWPLRQGLEQYVSADSALG